MIKPNATLPFLDQLAQLGIGVDRIGQLEIVGGAVGVQQGAPLRAVALVEDRHGDIAHLVGGGVTEQKQLHQRQDQDQSQQALIAETAG